MFVYLITNKVNGKQYVGQHSGNKLSYYWGNTIRSAVRYQQIGKRCLYNALRKHGPENFECKPLVIVGTKEWMDYYEKACIKAFNTKAPNGYNLTDGGEGCVGYIASNETRIKLRKASLGRVHTKETRKKMSISATGNKRALGTKRSIKFKQSVSERRRNESMWIGRS